MELVRAFYGSPETPTLFASEVLELSQEQRDYVMRILNLYCSDSRSAEKAYKALQYVLTGGSVVVPHINSLSPSFAPLGSPSFTLHVNGTGFGAHSSIVWNSSVEPTTFMSETELTTIVDMSTAVVAMEIPVLVQTGDGVLSNMMFFVLQEAKSAPKSVVQPKKEEPSLKVRESEK